jgi:hypothetical protein
MEWLRKGDSTLCILLGGSHQLTLRCKDFSIDKSTERLLLSADLTTNLRGSENQRLDIAEFTRSIGEVEGIQVLDGSVSDRFRAYVLKMGQGRCVLTLKVMAEEFDFHVQPETATLYLTLSVLDRV